MASRRASDAAAGSAEAFTPVTRRDRGGQAVPAPVGRAAQAVHKDLYGVFRRRRIATLLLVGALGIGAVITILALDALYRPEPLVRDARILAFLSMCIAGGLLLLPRMVGPDIEPRNVVPGALGSVALALFTVAMVEDMMGEVELFSLGPAGGFFLIVGVVLGPHLGCVLAGRLWADARVGTWVGRWTWRALAAAMVLPSAWGIYWLLIATTSIVEQLTVSFPVPAVALLVLLGTPAIVLGLAAWGARPWLDGGRGTFHNLVAFVASYGLLVNAHLVLRAGALGEKAEEAFRSTPGPSTALLLIAAMVAVLLLRGRKP